jgi:hypothetical protein
MTKLEAWSSSCPCRMCSYYANSARPSLRGSLTSLIIQGWIRRYRDSWRRCIPLTGWWIRRLGDPKTPQVVVGHMKATIIAWAPALMPQGW